MVLDLDWQIPNRVEYPVNEYLRSMRECANMDDGKCRGIPVEKIEFFNTRISHNFWLCQNHLNGFLVDQTMINGDR